MDTRFLPHNTHLEKPEVFIKQDPHLKQLNKQALVHRSRLLDRIPRYIPGIYTLSGGRQTGKTTLLKQWMAELLESRVPPNAIAFMTGELVDDHHSLIRLVTNLLTEMPDKDLKFIFLDEVTYIRDWDKGVKYLADAGMLENTVLVITGSDMVIIKEARMRFPGRRGISEKVDFHLYPLCFLEYVKLSKRISNDEIDLLTITHELPRIELLDRLFEEFDRYLSHGGFLTAINDMAMHQRILPATFSTYSDWIRGDVLKRNKQEHYLLEILQAIVKRYGSQITWNALAHDLSIDHPKTVADYVALLVSMDATFVQAALLEDKLTASPKKAKKLMFADPFIFHAVNSWVKPCEDPFNEQLKPTLANADWSAKLVEACVTTHYRRIFPTYYIKSKGEVDIAYVDKNQFWPVEVKWSAQLRPKQLKQITKYSNGLILTKSRQQGEIHGIPTIPLPLALLRIGLTWK
jgi:predicted AAA+ superfamily ATPase